MKTGSDDLESHSARSVKDLSPIAAPSDLTICSLVHHGLCTSRASNMSTRNYYAAEPQLRTPSTWQTQGCNTAFCFKALKTYYSPSKPCVFALRSNPVLAVNREPCLTAAPLSCLSVALAALCLPHPCFGSLVQYDS